jgi:hypothetical protein
MTQCPQCGQQVDTATDFCGNCGYYVGWEKTMAAPPPTAAQRPGPAEPVITELPPQEPQQQRPHFQPGPAQPPPAGPTVVCGVCGDVNPQGRTYCQRCGERLPAAGAFVPPPPAPDYPPTMPYQRRLNPKVLLAVAAAVVLIIIGVIFASTRGGGNPPQTKGTTTPATATTSAEPTGSRTTAPPVTPTKVDPGTIDAEASSELPPQPQRGLSYGIGNTLDGNLRTAWNSNGNEVGTGAGQVLRYRFADKVHLQRIDLVNGYVKSDKTFTENGRIKTVAITTDAGTFEVTLTDTKQQQSLAQDFGVTDSVSLRVIAVYKGSQFPDLGLTEIAFLATPAG